MKRIITLSLAALLASGASAGAVYQPQNAAVVTKVWTGAQCVNADEIWQQLCEEYGVPCLPLPGCGSQNNTKPETKPEEAPETKPEETPETKPEQTPETKPEETPETQPEETPEQAPETDASLSAYAAEVVRLVNAERAKQGLAALQVDLTVARAAQVRAGELKSLFSHTRPNGTSCFTALKEAGVSYRSAGENIAYGQQTPAAVMNAWMNSEGHRANILNSGFTTIGVGYTVVNGTPYWTQFFTA